MSSRLERAHLHVTVRTGRAPARPLWVRVFRTGRRPILLGFGPLVPNDFGSATGVVLLPAELRAAVLIADVTDRPDQPWRTSALRTTARAVRMGRDAGRAERQDDRAGARQAWQTCASLWDQQRDDRRAALAREYAAGRRGASTDPRRRGDDRQPVDPFVSDHLAARRG